MPAMPRVADISLGSSDASSGRAKSIPTLFGQGVFAVAAVKKAIELLRGDQSSEARRHVKTQFGVDEIHFLKALLDADGDRRPLIEHQANEVDPRDAKTPDAWVPRHKDLIRLTGIHPFNVEPHLTDLMNCGLITPAPLHLVRNHGAVPRLDWDTHRVTVGGLVGKEKSYTMDQLASMKSVTFPMLLVCAGNRRKEQNMRRQTIGFNWGPAGLSNSIWTGVPLHVLLKNAGVTEVTAERQYVCFVGPDGELPKGKDGSYGTSVPLAKALDPAQDIMIAYAQNGEKLRPDHGFPVRVIIPGFIGGRMIKFLCGITVTSVPSDNFYHFRDNRILPPHVTSELAEQEGWWEKPEYIFNELNINSAISSPAHDEKIPMFPGSEYTVKGYAYTGGGRSITRVEVSVDGGHNWRLATHKQPPLSMYGKQWSWAHWQYTIDCDALAQCDELMCRAWDEGNNTQPRDLTWNLMGMGNNPWFRVKTKSSPIGSSGERWLTCEHPTEPASKPGGWMGSASGGWNLKVDTMTTLRAGEEAQIPENQAEQTTLWLNDGVEVVEDKAPAVSVGYTPPPPGAKLISLAEVEKHDDENDCWLVVKGKVYDVNAYLKDGSHPGGNASITMNAGVDSTEDFEAVHSAKAWKQLETYVIGYLDPKDDPNAAASAESTAHVTLSSAVATKTKQPRATGPVNLLQYALANPDLYGNTLVGEAAEAAAFDRMWAGARRVAPKDAPITLNPKKWVALEVDAKVPLSHDTILLRLKLDSPEHQCGLPVGYHVYLRGEKNGEPGAKTVMRAYTPSSLNGTLGFVEFVIKVYFPNDAAAYPEGGALTRYLNEVTVGEFVDAKGPAGEIKYDGKGVVWVHGLKKQVKQITMLAGGTGVAPMLQMIVAILADPDDTTVIKFLFANKSVKDILLKYTLDRLQTEHPGRFSVAYTVSKSDDVWKGLTGRVDKKMIENNCFAAGQGDETLALLCGPPLFETETCVPALLELGYAKENIVRY